MLYLAANNTRVRKFAANGVPMGWMISPGSWKNPGTLGFAIDNGRYRPPGETPAGAETLPPFYRLLDKVRRAGLMPMFVVIPDVPYDAEASRLLSREHLRTVRAFWPEVKCAVAVQDGAVAADLDGYDWVFVGGSTEWKWETARYWSEEAKKRGMRVHVARVNTHTRIQHCIDIGADSADGTGIWRGDRVQLACVVAALTQEGLWGQRARHLGVD